MSESEPSVDPRVDGKGLDEAHLPLFFENYFHVPHKREGSVSYHTVRFYARGEHLLHIDSDGDVYSVERLYELYPQGADAKYSNIG